MPLVPRRQSTCLPVCWSVAQSWGGGAAVCHPALCLWEPLQGARPHGHTPEAVVLWKHGSGSGLLGVPAAEGLRVRMGGAPRRGLGTRTGAGLGPSPPGARSSAGVSGQKGHCLSPCCAVPGPWGSSQPAT